MNLHNDSDVNLICIMRQEKVDVQDSSSGSSALSLAGTLLAPVFVSINGTGWRDTWRRWAPSPCRDHRCCSRASCPNSDTACILLPEKNKNKKQERDRWNELQSKVEWNSLFLRNA